MPVYEIYRLTRSREVLDDYENAKIGEDEYDEELHVVEKGNKEDEEMFGEFCADEYGYQDYDNIVHIKKVATLDFETLERAYKLAKTKKNINDAFFEHCEGMQWGDACKQVSNQLGLPIEDVQRELNKY